MPSACSAAGFALEIIPVALTTSRPAGMLRVTSSLRRSVCAARSFSIRCSRSSSFSCSRSFWMTPCIEAAMKAEGFCVRGVCASPSFFLSPFRTFRKYRRIKKNTTITMANSPTAEPTPNAHRLGGFAVCKPASIRSSFMSRKQSQPSRHHHWTKIHHQQCRNSQERPERELILAGDFPTQGIHTAQPATAGAPGQGSLPPRDVEDNNHGDPHQCSQQSPQQDRQERPAHAKEF